MNLFLKLPIYDRVILLEYIPDHDTFYTLLSMPEFGFLSNNNKLQDRIYESRLKHYFSEYESFYEENRSWKEIYDRLVILEKNINSDRDNLKDNINKFAKEGQLMELKILSTINIYPNEDGADWAAIKGHINVLKWMKENDLPLPDQYGTNCAARNGHINVLNWMKENDLPLPDQYGANWAAEMGRINSLEWIKENNLPLPDQYGSNWAAEKGHVNVLEWMKEYNLPLPDRFGTNWAAAHNYLNVLEWIKKNCTNIVWSDVKHYTSNSTILEWLDKQ